MNVFDLNVESDPKIFEDRFARCRRLLQFLAVSAHLANSSVHRLAVPTTSCWPVIRDYATSFPTIPIDILRLKTANGCHKGFDLAGRRGFAGFEIALNA
jgi:hypothetical protein